MVSEKTIARLSLYRRLLEELAAQDTDSLYSHQLAKMTGKTAAQVRRDIMSTGYSGTPQRGYDVRDLIASIDGFIDAPDGQAAALIGVGNLGRALLAYFTSRRPKLRIVASFDSDEQKVDRVIHGVRCHQMDDLLDVIEEHGVTVGIITVPASDAPKVADQLFKVGIRGILNFAPVPLKAPPHVYLENVDMTASLETVAYYAGKKPRGR